MNGRWWRHRWELSLAAAADRAQRRARLLPTWRTRRRRRLLAVLWLATCLLALSSTLVPMGLASAVIYIGAYAAWLVCWLLLRVLTRGVGEYLAPLLDERELALRGRYAYYGFQAAITSGALGVIVMGFSEPSRESHFRLILLFSSLLLTSAAVPTLLLGWTLPDDAAEDEEDAAAEDEALADDTAQIGER